MPRYEFSSEWELEGFLKAEMELIAKKHGGAVLFDMETRTMSFTCPTEREHDLVEAVTDAMHRLGLVE